MWVTLALGLSTFVSCSTRRPEPRSRAGVTGEVCWVMIWQLKESCKLGCQKGTFWQTQWTNTRCEVASTCNKLTFSLLLVVSSCWSFGEVVRRVNYHPNRIWKALGLGGKGWPTVVKRRGTNAQVHSQSNIHGLWRLVDGVIRSPPGHYPWAMAHKPSFLVILVTSVSPTVTHSLCC